MGELALATALRWQEFSFLLVHEIPALPPSRTAPAAGHQGTRLTGRVATSFMLIESALARWRTVNAPHLVALVRAGFEPGQLVERADGSGGDQQVAWHADPRLTDEFDRHAESVTVTNLRKGNPMTELNAEHARRAIVEYTRRLAESAAAAGPDTAVPTTPGWTITDLVEHVGQTQHWVAEIIERRITDPAQLPTQMAVLPTDPSEWQAWLSESAQRVASACSDDALDAPVFNAAGDERTGTRFWMTSVLNETVVHGFDAANAADRPADIDAEIAAALISNHLAMLTSPTWAMHRSESAHAIRGTGQRLQWLATDTTDDADDAGAWFVERLPDGATWQPGTQQADVTVTGPAGSLLLTMTRRLPLTDREAANISVDGDIDLAQHWLDNTAHVAD